MYPEFVSPLSSIDDAEGFDIAILVTAHKACVNIDWEVLLTKMRTPIVYDGRRVLDLENLSRMGWQAHAVGKPTNH